MLKFVLALLGTAALMAGTADSEMKLLEFKNFTRLIPANVLRGNRPFTQIFIIWREGYHFLERKFKPAGIYYLQAILIWHAAAGTALILTKNISWLKRHILSPRTKNAVTFFHLIGYFSYFDT